MKNDDLFKRDIIWRIAPILVSAIWVASYIFEFYPKGGAYCSSYFIIAPERFYIPIILSGIMVLLIAIFPFKFFVHGISCWLFGLLWLIDGGLIIALLIHLFGYAFFYRHGFLKTHKKIKFLIGGVIILAAIASQLRFTDINTLFRIFNFASLFTLITLALAMLNPEVQIIRKKRRENILVLPSGKFTEDDAEIFRKILNGTKYETIAKEENLTLAQFKAKINPMYKALKIGGLYDFLRMYANHTVVLEE